MDDKIEKIKDSFKETNLRPDDPKVVIIEKQLEAIRELANNKNPVFSQIGQSEEVDVNKANIFSDNPLPSINKRLRERGIKFQLSLPVLDKFITNSFELRHCTDRKRVKEYIDALTALTPRMVQQEQAPRPGILGSLRGKL